MIKAIRELPKVTFNIFFNRQVFTPPEFEDLLSRLFEPEDYSENYFYGPFLDGQGNVVVVRESQYKGGSTEVIALHDEDTRAISSDLKIEIVKNTAHIS